MDGKKSKNDEMPQLKIIGRRQSRTRAPRFPWARQGPSHNGRKVTRRSVANKWHSALPHGKKSSSLMDRATLRAIRKGEDVSDETTDDLAQIAHALEKSGNYRVLRRLASRDVFAPVPEGQQIEVGVIFDVETTGLDSKTDEVIELGMVKFGYSPDGWVAHRARRRLLGLKSKQNWLEPISQ